MITREEIYEQVKEKGLTELQKLWIALTRKKECIFCKKEFKEGIVNKHPGQTIIVEAFVWFSSEYLVHCQTTHGYMPETIDMFLDIMGGSQSWNEFLKVNKKILSK